MINTFIVVDVIRIIMEYCGECVSERPINDAKPCPDWVPDRPVVTVCPETATFEDVDIHSVSLPLASDALTHESEPQTNRIVKFLLTAGVIIVCLGIVMTVASIIFLIFSGI